MSGASLIPNKDPDNIIESIMTDWISKYGIPQKLSHDNRGEFVNKKLVHFLDSLGVRSMTSAAYSPFQNGIVERHNAIIKRTMDKIMKDENFNERTPKFVLNMAVMAKNPLLNRKGFSPFQLVLGPVSSSNGLESNAPMTEEFPSQIGGAM